MQIHLPPEGLAVETGRSGTPRVFLRSLCVAVSLIYYRGEDLPAASRPPDAVAETVSHQEISVTLPGEGWHSADRASATYVRVASPERWVNLSIWPIDPRLLARYWSTETHATAYFNMERHQPRDPGSHWENFTETEREVDGKRYPALTFELRYDGDPNQCEGTMLIYFPGDFDRRQRFYVIMYLDCHGPMESAVASEELDALVRSLSIGPYPSPGALMGLTMDAVSTEGGRAVSNPKALAKRFAKATRKKKSYRSELALIDRGIPELQSQDYVRLHWAMDYMAEDRYHVMQKGWVPDDSEFVYDEWIDLGTDQFINAGLWMKTPGSEWVQRLRELSQSLRLNDLVEILMSASPTSLSKHRFGRQSFYAFSYPLDPANPILSFPVSYSSAVEGPYSVRIWVNADTGLLAKADIFGAPMKPDAGPAAMEVVRVFGMWDQDFAIDAPRLELVPDRSEHTVFPPAPEIAYQDGNLLKNAIFQGQEGWQVWHRSNVQDQINIETVENSVIWERWASQNDGGSVGLYQDLDVSVSDAERVLLSLDVCVVHHTLQGAGWYIEERRGRGETPARVSITYLDKHGNEIVWDHGFLPESGVFTVEFADPKTGQIEHKQSGVTPLKNLTAVTMAEWSHVSFDLLDETVRTDPWGAEVLPVPAILKRITLFGNGWDFKAAMKNPVLRIEHGKDKL